MSARCQVDLYGLFAACMPQTGRTPAAGKTPRMMPDFQFTPPLDVPANDVPFERKAPHYGSTTYSTSKEGVRRSPAVRGPSLENVRTEHAPRTGRAAGHPPDPTSQWEKKLRSYDTVCGLVFGAWGEGSPEVNRLIGMLAHARSKQHWCSMQARLEDEAHGALAWMLQTACKENANLKLERREIVGRKALQQQPAAGSSRP